jgi:hypothetical protein
MGRPKGSGKKSPFADLDVDFKSSVEAAADDELQKKLADLSLAESDNLQAKKDDEDLANTKEAVKVAGEQYATASKQHRLGVDYIKSILEARGKR